MRSATAGNAPTRRLAAANGAPTHGPGRKRAVVLLSGGLDSCTAAAWAKAEGHELFAISFDYGQRHRRELRAAASVALQLGAARHLALRVPLDRLGGSALTDPRIAVPDAPGDGAIGSRIPATYVPARNTVFLALALAYAETVGAEAIVIGANALDYSGYPDCRPEYLEAFERMAQLATKSGTEGRPVRILAPLLRLGKADIVRLGARLGAPLSSTWSCYRGGARPCGRCESCVLRARGFAEAGIPDPASPSAARPQAVRRSGKAPVAHKARARRKQQSRRR